MIHAGVCRQVASREGRLLAFASGRSVRRPVLSRAFFSRAHPGDEDAAVRHGLKKFQPTGLRLSSIRVAKSVKFGGVTLEFNAGDLLPLSDGAALVQCQGSAVLAEVVSSRTLQESEKCTPLKTSFREFGEKASGPLPSSRRSGGEVARANRQLRASLRPFFPPGYLYGTQVTATELTSTDNVANGEILAVNAASLAMLLSDVPWGLGSGALGAVSVGLSGCGDTITFPSEEEKRRCTVVCDYVGNRRGPVFFTSMAQKPVEAGLFHELAEHCHSLVREIIDLQQDILEELGIEVEHEGANNNRNAALALPDPVVQQGVEIVSRRFLGDLLRNQSHDKSSREVIIRELGHLAEESLQEQYQQATPFDFAASMDVVQRNIVRENIFSEQQRCDNRALTDVREVRCAAEVRPGVGIASFQFGDSKALARSAGEAPNNVSNVSNANNVNNVNCSVAEFAAGLSDGGNLDASVGTAVRYQTEQWQDAYLTQALKSVFKGPLSDKLVQSEVVSADGSSLMSSLNAVTTFLAPGLDAEDLVVGVSVAGFIQTDDDDNIVEKAFVVDPLAIEEQHCDFELSAASTRQGLLSLHFETSPHGSTPALSHVVDLVDASDRAKHRVLDEIQALKE